MMAAFRVFLAQERIDLVLRPELPSMFPSDFLKHQFATEVLIALFEAEQEQYWRRPTKTHRYETRAYPIEDPKRSHLSKIARAVGINRATASDTVKYLEEIRFVGTEKITRKRYVSLTEEGRKAATWAAENLSPAILDYLKSKYGKHWFVRLLGIRRESTNT